MHNFIREGFICSNADFLDDSDNSKALFTFLPLSKTDLYSPLTCVEGNTLSFNSVSYRNSEIWSFRRWGGADNRILGQEIATVIYNSCNDPSKKQDWINTFGRIGDIPDLINCNIALFRGNPRMADDSTHPEQLIFPLLYAGNNPAYTYFYQLGE